MPTRFEYTMHAMSRRYTEKPRILLGADVLEGTDLFFPNSQNISDTTRSFSSPKPSLICTDNIYKIKGYENTSFVPPECKLLHHNS